MIKKIIYSFLILSPLMVSASSLYNPENRQAYVAEALEAMWSTQTQSLENVFSYMSVVEKNQCRSSIERLKLDCLIEAAKQNCKSIGRKHKKNCAHYSDISVINKMGENSFLPLRKKYKIMKNFKDFQKQIHSEVLNEYSKVALEFSFSKHSQCKKTRDTKCLATGMDKFCLIYGDKKDLSWQYCVGAIVWIIGKNGEE